MTDFWWSAEHTELVRTEYGRRDPALIACAVGRSASAVRNKAASLGLRTGSHRPWTTHELKVLRELYPTRGAIEVAMKLGRSDVSVYQRAKELGVPGVRRAKALRAQNSMTVCE